MTRLCNEKYNYQDSLNRAAMHIADDMTDTVCSSSIVISSVISNSNYRVVMVSSVVVIKLQTREEVHEEK